MRSKLWGRQSTVKYTDSLILQTPSTYLQALHDINFINADLERSDKALKQSICKAPCETQLLGLMSIKAPQGGHEKKRVARM